MKDGNILKCAVEASKYIPILKMVLIALQHGVNLEYFLSIAWWWDHSNSVQGLSIISHAGTAHCLFSNVWYLEPCRRDEMFRRRLYGQLKMAVQYKTDSTERLTVWASH